MIKLLDEATIQKISAGEVIERPASIVKELYENAIDADADEIQLEIVEGGKKSILMSDNGIGIESDQIELAFERHATSKITSFEDLYHSYTMGFRGEALASVRAVANVNIRSKSENEDIGSFLSYENNKLVKRSKIAMNTGTIISIDKLFENIPVRKKFLKSSISEANQITDLISKLALGKDEISTKYTKDDKLIFHTKKEDSHLEKVEKIFGRDFAGSLKEGQGKSENFQVKLYYSDNSYYRGNRSLEFIYLNSRYIDSLELKKYIESLYTYTIPNGKFPGFQLYIETKADNFDVNVHPNKTKVVFNDLDEIKELLKEILKDGLSSSSLSQVNVRENEEKKKPVFKNLNIKYKSLLKDYKKDYNIEDFTYNNSYVEENKDQLNDFDLVSEDCSCFDEDEKNDDSNKNQALDFIRSEAGLNESYANFEDDKDINKNPKEYGTEISFFDNNKDENSFIIDGESTIDIDNYIFKGGIFTTYLAFENTREEKLILLDQHAAHERINFERLMRLYEEDSHYSQKILLPIELDLSDGDLGIVRENDDIFKKFAYKYDYSDKGIKITEVPSIDNINHKIFFLDLIDGLGSESKGSSILMDRLIQRACKSSIKAKDILTEVEARRLVKDLNICDYPLTCPHGRPTYIIVNKTTIDKEFKRIK